MSNNQNNNLPLSEIPLPVFIINQSGEIQIKNELAAELLGTATKIQDLFEEISDIVVEQINSKNIEKTTTTFNDKCLELTFKVTPIETLVFIYDLTDMRKTETLLKQSKAFLRKVIDTDPNLIFVKNTKGEFTLANQTVAQIYGTTIENIIGKTDADFNPNSSEVSWFNHDDMFVINEEKELEIKQEKVTTKDGKVVWLETKKLPIKSPDGEIQVLGISSDITKRKLLQEQLLHSQKLEAVGKLAGGIAHDFNNLLTGILGYTSLLQISNDFDGESKHAVNSIRLAAERASNLTQQLLAFARKGKNQDVPINMHELIEESIDLISRTFEKNIIIEKDLSASAPYILGDPTQIQQAVINLALNARDAMSADKSGTEGGKLYISTSLSSEITDGSCKNLLSILVKDTGCGIPVENINKIFEPFYTTKGENGTGMGLPMVYGIVKNHNGNITVNSCNLGTEFKIQIPCLEKYIKIPVIEKIIVPKPKNAMVLLVDDHAMIRDVTAQMLGRLGYQVMIAKDGVEAIKVYRENYHQISLVLLDMVMPKLSAKEIFSELRIIKPDVRVVLSTGYVNNLAVQSILNQGMVGFVQKPYHIESLSKAMSLALAS